MNLWFWASWFLWMFWKADGWVNFRRRKSTRTQLLIQRLVGTPTATSPILMPCMGDFSEHPAGVGTAGEGKKEEERERKKIREEEREGRLKGERFSVECVKAEHIADLTTHL